MSRIAAIRSAAGASASTPADNDEQPDITETTGDSAKAGKPKKKDKVMSDDNSAQVGADAIATAATEATKAANARFSAVMASDEYKGREALSHHLLGSTDMDAAGIITTLAAAPKPGAVDQAAVAAAAEAAARSEMQSALLANKPTGVDAGGGAPASEASGDSTALWGKVHARMGINARS